jgi:hypothetical protein
MKIYKYVGPKETFKSVKHFPKGVIIHSRTHEIDWIKNTEQKIDYDASVIATFVIDEDGSFRIADRHSEHVACAGRLKVYSAGEVTFEIIDDDKISIPRITNQSTGYCPEPESWKAVENAINETGIAQPGHFTSEFIFRRCNVCGSINIVKDGWFFCIECDAELEKKWNFS